MLRLEKFEWKIILALLMTAVAPLVITVVLGERLVEESMLIGLNEQVISGLRSGVELYKENIESRIRIVRLQGEALSKDSGFQRSVRGGAWDKVGEYLDGALSSNHSIARVRVLAGPDTVIDQKSSLSFPEEQWKGKTESWPLSDGHRLEVTFVISKSFLEASEKLRQLVVTLESLKANIKPWKAGYYRLFLFIYIWILLAAVGVGVWLSRSVTKRVSALVDATKAAASGDLSVRVPVTGQDEIGLLTTSFNYMLNELYRTRDRIVYLEKVSSWQEIARSLAHEIKNPLTPIQLAVQELHSSYRGDDPVFLSKLNDSLEIVEEEVAALRRMVENFSEFAKMPVVQFMLVDLNAYVADFVRHNPQLAPRVRFTPGEKPLSVNLDRDLMRRVLLNLINNGLEASEPDGLVEIQLGQGPGWVNLRVIDRGIGLTKEVRERLFRPYFTTKATGTGLGLAFVKKVILQHGGEISVEEGAPKGTVMTIRLPDAALPPKQNENGG